MTEKLDIVSMGFNREELIDKFNIDGDITFIDNVDDIFMYKADILIIDLCNLKKLFDELYNCEVYKYQNNHMHLYEKYDLYEYDRLNRSKFKNYRKVFIVSIDCLFDEYNYKNIYSNIYYVNGFNKLDLQINDNNFKISSIKNKNILKLKEYVDKQENYFDSKEIMKQFNVSSRWIKRYMKDMNDIYNNIGYSYSKRKWYKVEIG